MVEIYTHKLAELFCGPGGLALGAKQAEVRNGNKLYKILPVWANDIDESACKTYRQNIHPQNLEAVVCDSVDKLDLKAIPEFNGLAFGFPCNDFSRVGEQKGIEGKFGPLYSYGVKVLNVHNPEWFVAENVRGLTGANLAKTFNRILSELKTAGKKGYLLTVHLYKFEEYGVPQQRHRIIIVGIRSDLSLRFKIPIPTTKDKRISAKYAIENPPIDYTYANHEFTRQSKTVIQRLEYIQPGENAWTATLPKHLRLNVKGAKLSQIYRRLRAEQPAYTITGSGGGGTHTYHWKEPRALTNRERARLQTFPDDYIFLGSKENVRKQIGMAVPPVAAKIIFEALLKTFAGIEYNSVEANYIFE